MGTQNPNLTAEADGTFAVVNLPKFVGFSVDNSQLLQQAMLHPLPLPWNGVMCFVPMLLWDHGGYTPVIPK